MTITWKTLLLVFAGGTIGSLLRLGASYGLDGFTAAALVNILGSAALGWLNADPRFASENKRAFWAVGFAGGFTTMSGLALVSASGLVASIITGALIQLIVLPLVALIFAGSLLAYWGTHALTSRLTGNDAAVSHDVEEVTE